MPQFLKWRRTSAPIRARNQVAFGVALRPVASAQRQAGRAEGNSRSGMGGSRARPVQKVAERGVHRAPQCVQAHQLRCAEVVVRQRLDAA